VLSLKERSSTEQGTSAVPVFHEKYGKPLQAYTDKVPVGYFMKNLCSAFNFQLRDISYELWASFSRSKTVLPSGGQ